MIRGKKIGYQPVAPEVKAARAKMAAEREQTVERHRLEEVANDSLSAFSGIRALLIENLGEDLSTFLAMVRNTNATVLKNELLHLEKIQVARKQLERLKRLEAAAQSNQAA